LKNITTSTTNVLYISVSDTSAIWGLF